MKLKYPGNPYICKGTSYSEDEVMVADEIKSIMCEDEKSSQIEAFETVTGKRFPFDKPVKLQFNADTAFIGSFPGKAYIGAREARRRSWWR